MPVQIVRDAKPSLDEADEQEIAISSVLPGLSRLSDGGDGEFEVVGLSFRRGPHDDWLLVARCRFSDPQTVGASSYSDPDNCYVGYAGSGTLAGCLAKFERTYRDGTLKLLPDRYAQTQVGSKPAKPTGGRKAATK